MIFVTVGTHEQPFNRLVKAVDDLKANDSIHEDIFIQTGYSTYRPRFCEWTPFLSYVEMDQKIKAASIVISHGGPASFLTAMKLGVPVLIVPRQMKYGEHVNNHQLVFVKELVSHGFVSECIEDTDELSQKLQTISNHSEFQSHNQAFITEFNKIVGGLWE